MINTQKLSQELISAGITTHGNCNSAGIVWDDDNNEIQSRPDVAAIIAAHNPTSKTWDAIKSQRNILLLACDWTQLPDAVLTINEKSAWQKYRQALRDISQNYASPDDVIFPEVPA